MSRKAGLVGAEDSLPARPPLNIEQDVERNPFADGSCEPHSLCGSSPLRDSGIGIVRVVVDDDDAFADDPIEREQDLGLNASESRARISFDDGASKAKKASSSSAAPERLARFADSVMLTRVWRFCMALYGLHGLFSIASDVLSDIIFFIEFRRTFPGGEKLVWEVTLIVSMVLPVVLCGLYYVGGVMFRHVDHFGNMLRQCILFIVALPVLFFMIALCDVLEIIHTFKGDGRDAYSEGLATTTREEFLLVRGLIIGIFEDIPQLSVQTHMFFLLGNDPLVDFSAWALCLSFALTISSLLQQAWTLWKLSSLLDGTDLSVPKFLAVMFRIKLPDDQVLSAYSQLILQGKFPFRSISLAGKIATESVLAVFEALHEICDEDDVSEASSSVKADNKWRLDCLNLACCGLGDTWAKAIADAVEAGLALNDLVLQDNFIGDEGVAHLARSISSPACQLNELTLDNNQFGDAGALALANAIETNTCTLKVLRVRWNRSISKVGYDALADAVKKNDRFRQLVVHSCPDSKHLKEVLGDKAAIGIGFLANDE